MTLENHRGEYGKVRREKDYTDILVQGLSYPWPAVAGRGQELVRRDREDGRPDLIPNLITMLESPDPRLPIMKANAEHKIEVVRELVKVNHHRNCMMCHAPGTDAVTVPTCGSSRYRRPRTLRTRTPSETDRRGYHGAGVADPPI